MKVAGCIESMSTEYIQPGYYGGAGCVIVVVFCFLCFVSVILGVHSDVEHKGGAKEFW